MKKTIIFAGGKGATQKQMDDLKEYVDDSMVGAGAVRGVPCQIQSVTPITGGKRVNFLWVDNAGGEHTESMDVMNGVDGKSVTGASIGTGNRLILTLSDGTSIDAGELPVAENASAIPYTNVKKPDVTNVKNALDAAFSQSAGDISYSNTNKPTLTNVKLALDAALSSGATLSESLTVNNPVGSATSGKVYAANTSLETVIRDMLIKEEAPTLTLNISPNRTLYDIVEETVSSITMNAVVGKKTYPLSKVEFYVDNVLKNTQNITSGGTYAYIAAFSPAKNSNFTLKAIAYDSKAGTPLSTTKTQQIKFVAKSYWGTVDDSTPSPTEAIIKALANRTLKDVKNLTYSHITMDYGKVVYAYPATFGALTYIKDEVNNFSYLESFSRTSVIVDGITYFCYTQMTSSQAADVQLVFK